MLEPTVRQFNLLCSRLPDSSSTLRTSQPRRLSSSATLMLFRIATHGHLFLYLLPTMTGPAPGNIARRYISDAKHKVFSVPHLSQR